MYEVVPSTIMWDTTVSLSVVVSISPRILPPPTYTVPWVPPELYVHFWATPPDSSCLSDPLCLTGVGDAGTGIEPVFFPIITYPPTPRSNSTVTTTPIITFLFIAKVYNFFFLLSTFL